METLGKLPDYVKIPLKSLRENCFVPSVLTVKILQAPIHRTVGHRNADRKGPSTIETHVDWPINLILVLFSKKPAAHQSNQPFSTSHSGMVSFPVLALTGERSVTSTDLETMLERKSAPDICDRHAKKFPITFVEILISHHSRYQSNACAVDRLRKLKPTAIDGRLTEDSMPALQNVTYLETGKRARVLYIHSENALYGEEGVLTAAMYAIVNNGKPIHHEHEEAKTWSWRPLPFWDAIPISM